MTAPGWRYFAFFERSRVDLDGSFEVEEVLKDASILESGRGRLLVADSKGYIHILSKTFAIVQKFAAYEGGRVTHMKQLKQRNMLVTLGEEEATGSAPVLRVWDLDRTDRRTGSPLLQRSFKVQVGNKPFPVSAFACLESLAQVAFGLADGKVLLLRGDISRDRTVKPKIIHESNEPVTGVGFREAAKTTTLYIVTTNKVLSCITLGKDSGSPAQKIDDVGASLHCSVVSPSSQDLVIATEDAIMLYGDDGRGPTFALPGSKSSIQWLKSYFAIVAQADAAQELSRLTIFDSENKFIAYAGSFPEGVRGIVSEWGELIVVTYEGKLYRLEEKDTFTKLDILFKKSLFQLAINLAHSQKYDDASIAEIFRKYGEHLYAKGDFDAAMQQYVRTIGQLEPSYVIRKFLDAQRIHNLTTYLEQLHSQGLATSDHTTLLLNCYTKLKAVTQLDKFIKTDSFASTFDLETAINVCRKAGFHDHAVYLAEKFGDHNVYLRIQLEDAHEYAKVVRYVRQLSPTEAESNLKTYGKTLLDHLPDETTQLLIDLCTGNLYSVPDPVRAPSSPSNGNASNAYLGGFTTLMPNFGVSSPPTSVKSATLQPTATSPVPSASPINGMRKYKPPSARTFSPTFVDHPIQFTRFLEALVSSWGYSLDGGKTYAPMELPDVEAADQKSVWNTLVELYLGESGMDHLQGEVAKTKERMLRREKAMRILKTPKIPIDENQALILCFLANFTDGVVYLYERMCMYEDILRFHMSRDDTQKVISSLHKYGPKQPHLYPLTLTYFTSSPTTLDASRSELLEVLAHIDEEGLMPPLQVIQALGQSGFATVGMVREYLSKRVEGEREEAQGNAALIDSYRKETEEKRKEMAELKSGTRIVQATRCTTCGGSLDLPAVHFVCKHSFHQRCLEEDGTECPVCATSNRRVRELRKAQQAGAKNSEGFFARLADAEDGFGVIAEWFSKDAMSPTEGR